MTTKEILIDAIDKISERDKVKLLSVIELYQSGVDIIGFCHKRPVVKVEELSKIDIKDYFNDGLSRE